MPAAAAQQDRLAEHVVLVVELHADPGVEVPVEAEGELHRFVAVLGRVDELGIARFKDVTHSQPRDSAHEFPGSGARDRTVGIEGTQRVNLLALGRSRFAGQKERRQKTYTAEGDIDQ